MKTIYLLALTVFFFSLISYGQEKSIGQFMFDNKDMTYITNDTIKITYDLDSQEILHSNFGGCGGGAVYCVICHSDSLYTMGFQPSCDYLLMEYSYSVNGIVEIVIDSPGVYSVVFFTKNKAVKEVEESNVYKQTLETPKFNVIARKQE